MYEIKWSYGNAEPKRSTMFPDSWSRSKVIEKIYEALKDPKKETNSKQNRLTIKGKTQEGIEIKIVLDLNKDGTAKIVSAYPIIDSKRV